MSDDSIVYLTQEGLQKIKEELEHLKTHKRVELSHRLAAAVAMGDLSENADYHYAKQEQGFVEGRIKTLEDSLRRAKIIEDRRGAEEVHVGSVVSVVVDGEDEPETYHIVGAHEADPRNGRISNQSPIGRALLGAKVGQTVVAHTPAGRLHLQIQAIQ
ncbi:MAG: transcription elongation factor GreA [Chloroflexota bacterium]